MSRTDAAVAAGFRTLLDEADARTVVWLDSTAYARRLFAPGEDVWADVGRHVELVRQAQRLLGSEVIEVRLGPFHRAALEADPSMAEAQRGRRLTTALRRLLEQNAPIGIAHQIAGALGVLYPATPIVLVVEGGGRWLQWAASVTENDPADIDVDGIDAAAVYVADAIRPFGASPVSGIALDLRGHRPVPADVLVDLHGPVLNLAGDYGWPIAVVVDDAVAATAVGAGPVDAVLCPGLGFEALRGLEVPARLGGGLDGPFWSGSTTFALPGPTLAYGEIPADAQPEIVLTKLAELRTH